MKRKKWKLEKIIQRIVALVLVVSLLSSQSGLYTVSAASSDDQLSINDTIESTDSKEQFKKTALARKVENILETTKTESADDTKNSDQTGISSTPQTLAVTEEEEPTEPTEQPAVPTEQSEEPTVSSTEGRDEGGQIFVTIGDTEEEQVEYTLIGDKAQLQYLDTLEANKDGINATGPIWKVKAKDYDNKYKTEYRYVSATLVYPGDADLIQNVQTIDYTYNVADGSVSGRTAVTKDFSAKPLYGIKKSLTADETLYILAGTEVKDQVELGHVYYCQKHGSSSLDSDKVIYVTGTLEKPLLPDNPDNPKISTYDYGKYTANGNYIIFRDISLKHETWEPLAFTGRMLGVKSTNGSKLWDAGHTQLNMNVGNPAVISEIKVEPVLLNGKLEVTNNTGVGFFSTISGKYDDEKLESLDHSLVQNITLRNGTVTNLATEADVDQTLVSGLTTLLGGLVGGLLDGLVWLLTFGSVKLNLGDTLSSVLNARKEDPNSLATGAFAGCITGAGKVLNCTVEDIEVTTVCTKFEDGSSTIFDGTGKHCIVGKGGFVGYVEGETQYDFLSDALGGLVDLLSGLLNVIPGLGLGDLITILLGNVVNLEALIPIGFLSPTIKDCKVKNGTLSTEAGKYGVGGFAGSVGGTLLENCSVEDSEMVIHAEKYGGGLVGVLRDGMIIGTLNELGVDVVAAIQPQAELRGCSIKDSKIKIEGTSHLGGFAGAQANSYIFNCETNEATCIEVCGDSYVGRVSGYAGPGTAVSIGSDVTTDDNLLSVVSGLLTGLLGGSGDMGLLTLVGVSSSAVMGCQIQGSVRVEAHENYAGGIVGMGEGVYITESSEENIRKLVKYGYKKTDGTYQWVCPPITSQRNSISALQFVSAENYAGGIAGLLTTSSVAGLLDSTIGVGSYLEFTVSQTDITGYIKSTDSEGNTDGGESTGGEESTEVQDGYAVIAGNNYAGGGVGMAIGGTFLDVKLNEIRTVTADNWAAGFVGYTGPGALANDTGLNVQLLGLDLVKAENLLSVVDGIRTTYTSIRVKGISDGFTVETRGYNKGTAVTEYSAGGFVAKASSVEMTECKVENLKSVTANYDDGFAGGFVGVSIAGGIAEVGEDGTVGGNLKDENGKSLLDIGSLVSAVPYLIPYYEGCYVQYAEGGYVQADCAGGFAGEFQSGKVNTKKEQADYADLYAVHDVDHITGVAYAGGFGGKVYSGALAGAGGGLSLLGILNLSITANDLLGLVNAYVPIVQYAGVRSRVAVENGVTKDLGFVVSATPQGTNHSQKGKAGGYIGYGSGVQISNCDVKELRHTEVKEPEFLEAFEIASYFSQEESSYSVTATEYAGGYIGHMDVGSAASVGGGLSLLGENINLNNVLDTLNVVVSTVEHSDVTGGAGGFSVLADGENGKIGIAGGFVGRLDGGHIQDSNSYNFAYIIGRIAAGGYVGDMRPGSVANVLGEDSSILKKLVNIDANFLSVGEDFVPTINNSETTCIPCGGAVRAQAASDESVRRGMAGGYCGHNEGGNIWGDNGADWKGKKYEGPTRLCRAVRILSVFGTEYAGGFTGYMEAADTAQGGSLSLLFGLVEVENLLGALSIVYPTEKNTAVYGPLRLLDKNTWNTWVDYVGQYGVYGLALAAEGKVNNDDELAAIMEKYSYGYHVTAGRSVYNNNTIISEGGCAGGYVGLMVSGVITNAQTYGVKQVAAMKAAGGFVGEMRAGGAASLGSISILGLELDLGKTVDVLKSFVPTIQVSSTEGYKNGCYVYTTGDAANGCGYAGGYVGYANGAQIWGDETETQNDNGGCNVTNLRKVSGSNAVGGYVGYATAGTVADVNTDETSSGALQGLLNKLLSSQGSLLTALKATLTTIRQAKVTSADQVWGFVVDGEYAKGVYAPYAGGFAGHLEAAVIGQLEGTEVDTSVAQSVEGLRGVIGGYYAGGFFGLADMGQVAEVGGSSAEGDNTSILMGLLNVGDITALDAFRSYVYNSKVEAIEEGCTILAYQSAQYGSLSEIRYNGDAGGFGGALLNGSVKSCHVTNLLRAEGPNYVGGFIGHLGKGGVVDVNKVNALGQLLNLGANALNVFGSHVEDCTLTGVAGGFTVKALKEREQAYAGGFIGYADLSRVRNCDVTNLSKVCSTQMAGGFAGKTDMTYLINAEADSVLADALLQVVNVLLKALHVDDLENLPGVEIDIPFVLDVELLQDGNLAQVTLLSVLIVSVSLAQDSNVAEVKIGDSSIELNVKQGSDGSYVVDEESWSNVEIHLIKGNRTEIENCTVTGIPNGYDVFGGSADEILDGSDPNGYAGGFVGYNNEGKLTGNEMLLCDVVRGSKPTSRDNNGNDIYKVGPFTGRSVLETVYDELGNTLDNLETENYFTIYRPADSALTGVVTKDGVSFHKPAEQSTTYNEYRVLHREVIKIQPDLLDAKEVGEADTVPRDLLAVVRVEKEDPNTQDDQSGQEEQEELDLVPKVVLMLDQVNEEALESVTPEPADMLYPCGDDVELTIAKVWKDYGDFANARPESIIINVSRSYKDETETVIEEGIIAQLTLTAEDASKWATGTWRGKVTEDKYGNKLTSAVKIGNSPDSKQYNYTYMVEEVLVDGYVTTIESYNAGYTFTITNRFGSELPETGAAGSLGIVMMGAVLICLGYSWKKRDKMARKEVNR